MDYDGHAAASALAEADGAMRAGEFSQAEMILSGLAKRTSDFAILLRLAAVRRRCGDHVGALEALTDALVIRPDDLAALLMKGSILRAFGRREEAARAYGAAIRVAPPADRLPPQMRAELDLGHLAIAEDAAWRRRLSQIDLEAKPALKKLRRDILAGGDGPLLIDGLPTVGFYDPEDFLGVTEFEANTPQILKEFEALVAERVPELISGHGAGLGVDASQTRKWSAIHLISDGEIIADNARFAPLALESYQRLGPPRIAGRSPNLMFSILDPHTHIPPHHGVINSRLVLHIPLIVPPQCGLRVGAETRAWEPGTALVFDDTVEHEAWNDSDEMRVVLLGDLWRPELDALDREAIAAMMARD